jgi:hypothetical protein
MRAENFRQPIGWNIKIRRPHPGFTGWIGGFLTSGPDSARYIRWIIVSGRSDRAVRDG